MAEKIMNKQHIWLGVLCGIAVWLITLLVSGTAFISLLFPLAFSIIVIVSGIYSVKNEDFAFFKGFSFPAALIVFAFCTIHLRDIYETYIYGEFDKIIEIIFSVLTFPAFLVHSIIDRINEVTYYISRSDNFATVSYAFSVILVVASFIVAAVVVHKKRKELESNHEK